MPKYLVSATFNLFFNEKKDRIEKRTIIMGVGNNIQRGIANIAGIVERRLVKSGMIKKRSVLFKSKGIKANDLKLLISAVLWLLKLESFT